MTKKTYSFQEQVSISKKFEEQMLNYWRSLEHVIQVGDVREKEQYQKMDIDFIHLRLHAGILKARTLELKVDFRIADTGNLFIEVDGWLSKTKAETLAYLDAVRKLCYYIDTKKLRDYIESRKDLREVKVYTTDFGGYEVTGRLLPYADMVEHLYPYVEDLKDILN